MNIHGWRQLVEWSVQHSMLSRDEKATAREILSKEWEEFCSWIITEYEAISDALDIQE